MKTITLSFSIPSISNTLTGILFGLSIFSNPKLGRTCWAELVVDLLEWPSKESPILEVPVRK